MRTNALKIISTMWNCTKWIYVKYIKNLHQNEKIALNMFLVTIIKLSKDLLYLNLKEGFMYSPKNVLGSQSLLFFSNTNIHVCNTSTELKIFLKKRFLLVKMFYQNASKFQKGKSKVSWIEIPKNYMGFLVLT